MAVIDQPRRIAARAAQIRLLPLLLTLLAFPLAMLGRLAYGVVVAARWVVAAVVIGYEDAGKSRAG